MNSTLKRLAKRAGGKEGETWCKGYYAFTIEQLQTFADLVIKQHQADNYQVRTDNTQTIANMEAKIAELEQERNDLNYIAMERLHEIEAKDKRIAELEARLKHVAKNLNVLRTDVESEANKKRRGNHAT